MNNRFSKKWSLYIIILGLVIMVIGLKAGSYFAPCTSEIQLSKLRHNEPLLEFAKAVTNGDGEAVASFIEKMKTNEDFSLTHGRANLVNSFRGGCVKNVWAVQQGPSDYNAAIQIEMQYSKALANVSKASALFVFKGDGTSWKLLWYNPGSVIFPIDGTWTPQKQQH